MPAAPDARAWAALDAALVAALDLEGDSRRGFVASLAPDLRAALTPLLADALRDDPLLDHHAHVLRAVEAGTGPLAALPDGGPSAAAVGARVGPYRLESLVGEGGMGCVYRARRDDGVFDKTVALKVVRWSLALAGANVSARLRRERDLLAALDHVGIARLLDGGETDDGVPYLVTEFVDGAPITDYADAHALDVAARLRLVVDVARAVEHAHRRFVVHRDLKPSNVLVTDRDGAPRPVVLDFGIAKLLDVADAGSSAFPLTQTGIRLLTPAYAAPELFAPSATVTTATDVYGLGALLYELLTGHRPHDDGPGGAPTTEPTRPSRIVGTQANAAPATVRALAGDLDVICLKALHPDPARRYASASELADDLERHLAGRPVDARPDSLGYVASRFVRRNRALVAAVSVALVGLVGGLGAALVSLRNERAARAASEVATARALEASELLAGVLQKANPTGDGHQVTVREALDASLPGLVAVRSSDLRAYLLGVVGVTYVRLGEPVRADSLLALSLRLYGESASDTTVSKLRLSYASTRDAFADYRTALDLSRRVYGDQSASGGASVLSVRALSSMSRAEANLAQLRPALRHARHAVDLARAQGYRRQLPGALAQMGIVLSRLGHHADAVRVKREALQRYIEVYGVDDVAVIGARGELAESLAAAGRYREAVQTFRAVQAHHRRIFAPRVPFYTLASIASVWTLQRRYRDAAVVLDSAVTTAREELPPGHPDLTTWLTALASAHARSGAPDKAEAAAREALRRAETAADTSAARLAAVELARAQRAVRRR